MVGQFFELSILFPSQALDDKKWIHCWYILVKETLFFQPPDMRNLSKLPETRWEDYQEMQEDTEYFVRPYISFHPANKGLAYGSRNTGLLSA